MDYAIIVAVVSALIALASTLFAWQAVRAAERTYSVELITQLYNTYQSEEMLRDLRLVWKLYHQTWEADCETKEEAKDKTDRGIPIQEDSALKLFQSLDIDSQEYKAIHSTTNFWTYMTLLNSRRSLGVSEIVAFTSPRILGFLYPMEKALSIHWGSVLEERLSLKRMYQIIKRANSY
jgi:hypothetical protein